MIMYNRQSELTLYYGSLIVGILASCHAKIGKLEYHFFSIYLNYLFVLLIFVVKFLGFYEILIFII